MKQSIEHLPKEIGDALVDTLIEYIAINAKKYNVQEAEIGIAVIGGASLFLHKCYVDLAIAADDNEEISLLADKLFKYLYKANKIADNVVVKILENNPQ